MRLPYCYRVFTIGSLQDQVTGLNEKPSSGLANRSLILHEQDRAAATHGDCLPSNNFAGNGLSDRRPQPE